MTYNPFNRGNYPVGVRTITVQELTVEVWYPASELYRGRDLSDRTRDRFTFAPELPEATQSAVRDAGPASGRFPLLMHNHGALGHRRNNTVLCTHLASHGYIVASNDVPGNTTADMMNDVIRSRRGEAPQATGMANVNSTRWTLASQVIEYLIAGGDAILAGHIDGSRVGAFGQSAGGWATLGLNQVSQRIQAAFVMEPLWGTRGPIPNLGSLASLLRVDEWRRPVPTFLLAGELDPLIILEDLRELYAALPAPKRFANLRRAGHWHMTDNAEVSHETFRQMYLTSFPDETFDTRALGVAMRPFAELCSEENAADTMRALCLAHMDAHLKDRAAATAFLDEDLAGTFARRGIDIEIGTPVMDADPVVA